MSIDQNKTEKGSDRPMGFGCCGTGMDEAMGRRACSAIMKRHPLATTVFILIMGLFALTIPTGIILGIIAFFRTI